MALKVASQVFSTAKFKFCFCSARSLLCQLHKNFNRTTSASIRTSSQFGRLLLLLLLLLVAIIYSTVVSVARKLNLMHSPGTFAGRPHFFACSVHFCARQTIPFPSVGICYSLPPACCRLLSSVCCLLSDEYAV